MAPKPASTDQPTTEAAEPKPAEIDYTATNKWGVLLHVEGESKDDRRKRLARETQKARFAADPEFKAARKAASKKSHTKHRANDPAALEKKEGRLRALAAELGYTVTKKAPRAAKKESTA